MAPLVRTGGSRHTGLAALPHRNIHSSKGGYAALNFGLRYKNTDIIVAAPQYYLADYLDSDKFRGILDDILGEEVTTEKKVWLNMRLKTMIEHDQYKHSQRIFIHYSTQEHTYKEHVMDLLNELKCKDIPVQEDVGTYQVHSDLKYYFPNYIQTVICCLHRYRRKVCSL